MFASRGRHRSAHRCMSTMGTLLVVGAMALTPAAGLAETVVKMIPHADLKTVDPIQTNTYITRNHGFMIFDTLFGVDSALVPQPQMVGEYSISEDGLVYSFTLRDGLTWHDGQPVTSGDCVASLKRWGARDPMGQQLMERLDEMVAVDERTFKMVLKRPYSGTLYALGKISGTIAFIMPARLAQTDAFEAVQEPVGSGPFKFVKEEWVPGSKVVYARNTDYVPRSEPASLMAGGKVVNVDRVEWIYTPDPQTAQAALANGEVDILESPPIDLLPVLERAPGVKIETLDKLGNQGWIRLNHLHPPFNDPRARRAMLHLVDQEAYLAAIAGTPDFYKVCHAYFGCGTADESLAGADDYLSPDIEKAGELFKEAGYDGEALILLHPTDLPSLDTATQVTAGLLRKAGIEVELQAMDWSTLSARRQMKEAPEDGGWNIFHTYSAVLDVVIPPQNEGIQSNCDKAWHGWPCDETIEKLRAAWSDAPTQEAREATTAELHARIYDYVPMVIFGQWSAPVAYRDDISGMLAAPLPILWNLEKN